MNFKIKRSAQAGFTLIELIVVIVILGILAATALPKFADLSGDARKASIQAAKGSLASSMAMTHGKWLTNQTTYASAVPVEGLSVPMIYGYPIADTPAATAAGIGTDDYVITPNTAKTSMVISPKNVQDSTKCNVTYTAASSATAPAQIALTAGDCS